MMGAKTSASRPVRNTSYERRRRKTVNGDDVDLPRAVKECKRVAVDVAGDSCGSDGLRAVAGIAIQTRVFVNASVENADEM